MYISPIRGIIIKGNIQVYYCHLCLNKQIQSSLRHDFSVPILLPMEIVGQVLYEFCVARVTTIRWISVSVMSLVT